MHCKALRTDYGRVRFLQALKDRRVKLLGSLDPNFEVGDKRALELFAQLRERWSSLDE
jgi:hypothetical protein